ncbi:prolipoprotein diacylglyceryl transferase [Ammoniphilus oxalaticus]|uniref:Phosphatidylglycerol--prolipoprotein diacylglyceryl transferase n=1 Tax=Ammoniphilus oxalaticus TaxID=66863 RepID=A0A419SEQ6_9BACL|nr:prolipoprotein diacylglyceryl transferase [Ammoniphilus oxalaticus]RKD21816.1 prolipoprotein diacylglyceryl transferase [Ammoniphilus oxalaticus]
MDSITPLNPVAIQLGPIPIHWYGLILGSGALIGLLLAMRESKRFELDPDVFLDLVMWGVPISIICARIYYVVFEWDNYYRHHPGEIIAIWQGGIAIHGALIGAILTGIVFCRKRGLSFWRIADFAAPSILIGQAVGRWGNFMNQEAYGGPVSRAFLESLQLPTFIIEQMYIKGAYHHPTFLYESVWNLLGVGLLLLLRRKAPLRRGELFCSYLIWYSIGRFFIEGMRTDSLMVTDTLRAAQMISVAIIVVAIGLWIGRRKMGYAKLKYGE